MKHGMRKNNKTVGETILNIYIANLGKYNEGELVGEWISLPTTEEEIQETIDRVLVDKSRYEEIAIHDYETELSMKIGEYDNIFELNELLQEVEGWHYSIDLINAMMNVWNYTLEEAIGELDNVHYIQLDKDTSMSDEENLAYSYIESIGRIEYAVSNLTYYFDYEAFGRDLRFDLDIILDNMDEEDREQYYDMSDNDLAEWYIFDVLGDIDCVDTITLERYFDYEAFGRDLWSDFSLDDETMIALAY